MTSEEGEEEDDDDADEDMYWRFAAKGKPRRRTNRLVAPASWLSCASSWKKEPRQHFAILSLQMILVLFQDENTATMNFRGDVTRCYVPCHNNTCWCKSRLHCIHISGWDILIHCAIKKKTLDGLVYSPLMKRWIGLRCWLHVTSEMNSPALRPALLRLTLHPRRPWLGWSGYWSEWMTELIHYFPKRNSNTFNPMYCKICVESKSEIDKM